MNKNAKGASVTGSVYRKVVEWETKAGEKRSEAMRMADVFRARVVDATSDSFVFELTGASVKLDSFVALMEPLGLVEVCRTGIAALRRGGEGL